MKEGKIVPSYNNGTAYIISIGIPTRSRQAEDESYVATRNTEGHLYQYVQINGNELKFTTTNYNNKIIDSFTIKK